jgi:hypothetical protein
VISEHPGDLGSDPAGLLGHIRPAVPECHDARLGAGVIPVNVPPACVNGMRRPPIEFHGDPELLVMIVQIAGTAAHPAEGLPFRARQSMAPFDAANIVPLQYRVNAVVNVG